MPSYEFTGPDSRYYPEGRDASGRHLGNVEPGDIRILDEPPADGHWTPVTGTADGPHEHPGFGDVPMHGTEATADGTFSEIGGELPGETTPGPQPAPPAVIPGS